MKCNRCGRIIHKDVRLDGLKDGYVVGTHHKRIVLCIDCYIFLKSKTDMEVR